MTRWFNRTACLLALLAGQCLLLATPAAAETPDEKFVSTVYAEFLLRYPQPEELADGVDYIDNGGTRAALVANLLDGDEFKNLWVLGASLYYLGAIDAQVPTITNNLIANDNFVASEVALLAGTSYYTNNGGTNTLFVEALYKDTLLRPVDAPALSYWVGRLNAGTASRSYVANYVVRSTESATARVGGAGGITTCPTTELTDAESLAAGSYCIILDRMADSAGLAYWSNRLAQTDQLPALWASMTGSTEYFNLAQIKFDS